MHKVFLTGANGFLGNNIARELIKRKYIVHALIQEGTDPGILQGLDVILFNGDLLKPHSLISGLNGCDYVIHTAGITTINPARNSKIKEVNIEGTRNILNLLIEHPVKRIVHVGTANTFGFGTKDHPGNETMPYKGAQYQLDYMDSKMEAQKLVLSYFQEYHLPVLIVNPTFMVGPNDPGPSSNEMIRQIAEEGLPGYTHGGRNYIYVGDACTAIVNALTMGRSGECYILGNENLSYKEAFTLMSETIGSKPPKILIPGFLAIMVGALLSGLAGILPGFKPKITLPIAKISCDEQYFSAVKAVRELDLPQTPIRKAIRESYEWLLSNGMISIKKK
jgi:dihydroflavonol-4-reductase